MSRLTIKDIPLVNRFALKRWDIIDDRVKQNIKEVIHSALEEGTVKEKIAASNLALRIDRLNMLHEAQHTMKADLDITALSEKELDEYLGTLLNGTTAKRIIGETPSGETEEGKLPSI